MTTTPAAARQRSSGGSTPSAPRVTGLPILDLSARLAIDDEVRAWMLQARCLDADPEAFFPEKGGSTREAKRICAICPVKQECLSYALSNDERFGIWGGMSERERRRLKRLAT